MNIIPEDKECVVCHEQEKRYAIVPCGHVCFCESCINKKIYNKINSKCPVCRTDITSILKIHF